MGKLTDVQIRNWIKAGERFAGRGDGDGLYLRFRENDGVPGWLFRYQLAGKARTMLRVADSRALQVARLDH
jgi:hypothetical protein